MDRGKLETLFRLDDRVAIVTGGSRGMGREIAEAFAWAGARVVVTSRKLEACEEIVAGIREQGGQATAVATHMGDLDQLGTLVDTTVQAYGGVDILVNNAANALAQPFGSITPEAWEKSMAVNLRGPVFLMQAALPYLEASQHASIINMSSVGALMFSAFTHMYSAAKAGLLAYTRALAAELAAKNIRVNAIAPGTVNTDMVRNNPPELQELMAKSSLMGRAAEADEIVGLALYLASDASSFVTGATINIDGGLVAR